MYQPIDLLLSQNLAEDIYLVCILSLSQMYLSRWGGVIYQPIDLSLSQKFSSGYLPSLYTVCLTNVFISGGIYINLKISPN